MADSLLIKDFRMFFDRTTVERAISRYERRVLSRTGAFGRRVIRNSIRPAPRKKTYKPTPGRPPRYHVNPNTGLRLVLFEYSPARGSVIIGPLLFRRSVRRNGNFSRGRRTTITTNKPVPELVNEGGNGRIQIEYRSGHTYTRTTTHRAFPYRDLAQPAIVAKMRQLAADTELN